MALTAEMVKAQALSLGFDLCGICAADAYPELAFLDEWLARGYAGDMAYLGRTRRVRRDVRHILPSAQSVCGDLDTRILALRASYAKCVDEAVANAVAEVGSSKLAVLASNR